MKHYDPEQDIEFIRKKLEQLNQEIVPSHRISPDIMLQKLEQQDSEVKAKRVWLVPKNIAAVLCAGLVLCIALFYANNLPGNLSMASDAGDEGLRGLGIQESADMASMEEEFAALSDDYAPVRGALNQVARYTGKEDPMQPSAGDGKGGGGNETGGSGERVITPSAATTVPAGQTDILQTDGSYLYYAAGDSVLIAQAAKDGTLTFVSELDVLAEDRYVISLYQQGNALTLLCNDYRFTITQSEQNTGTPEPIQSVGTTVLMFDITDRSNPVLLRQFTQEGAYRSSVVSEQTIYLVSDRKTFDYSDTLPIEAVVPNVYDTAKGGRTNPIGAGSIIVPETAANASYVTVSALGLYDADAEAVTRTVLGGAAQVYCSTDGVVLINPAQSSDASDLIGLTFASSGAVEVARARLTGRMLGLDNTLQGNVLAVTQNSGTENQTLLNAISLDRSLGLLGSTTEPVPDRGGDVAFVGETAYVGNKQDDAIIAAFDFTQNAAPQTITDLPKAVLPENLIRLTDTLSLGVYSADVTGEGKGVKLVLVDTANNQFNVTSALTVGASGSFTEALRSHNAVLYDKENALLGIPVVVTSGSSNKQLKQEYSGYNLYRISGGKLTFVGKISSASTGPQDVLQRAALVNGVLYAVSDSSLISADAESLTIIDTLSWRRR